MKYNKLKAFTLAEIMVLLLTLSILMAAFAPVFTRRFNNATSDEVWTYIPGDDNYNAYFDAPNKLYLNQAFVGLTPISTEDTKTFIKDGANKYVYSKLIIAASKKLGGITGAPPQNQMQFRVSTSSTDAAGKLVGSLFAGNGNLLLGGPYSDITNEAKENTAYGPGALKSLKDGDWNTAVGNYALNNVTSGSGNTAIGYNSGKSLKTGFANTFVGAYAGAEIKDSVGYNTLIGIRAGEKVKGSGNTALGNYALQEGAADGNTAVGSEALRNATGKYNTAVGYKAMNAMKKGNYNTAIGATSCMFLGTDDREISKVTCIGAGSGAKDQSAKDGSAGLPTGNGEGYNIPDRVFIGKFPDDKSSLTSNVQKPFAVLEVHNSVNGPTSLSPIKGGEESVIINGNLVVRGMTYLETPIYRPIQGEDIKDYTPKGLVHYRTFEKHKEKFKVLGAFDGIDRTKASHASCRGCKSINFRDVRENCICTSVGPGHSGDTTFKNANTSARYSSTSYDWYSEMSSHNAIKKDNSYCPDSSTPSTYKDQSTGATVNVVRNFHGVSGLSERQTFGTRETDYPYAHMKRGVGLETACCPRLDGGVASDIRLKNVGEAFTAGLDQIKKINVYNYTYKSDKRKLPQVGVMAQDLKIVFPQAVFKNKDGYYTIRWDEMLYAAINAVKTLNTKINNLANKIATDKERIAALKRDNAAMNAQLDKLLDEIEVLEAKKK